MDGSQTQNNTLTTDSVKSNTTHPILIALLIVSLFANVFLVVQGLRPEPPPPTPAEPTGELKAYAAVGSFFAENNRIPDLEWTDEQFDAFAYGLRASHEGRGYPLDADGVALRDAFSAMYVPLRSIGWS